MNIKLRNAIRNSAIITLPLIVAVGCAGGKQNLVSAEPVAEPEASEQTLNQSLDQVATEKAIENMDAYMASLEILEPEASVDSLNIEEEVKEDVVPAVEPEVGITANVEEEASTEDVAEIDEALLQEEVSAIENAETESAPQEVLPPPKKLVLHFGFDKHTPREADYNLLKEHAEYLKKFPHMTLVINGHADSQGDKMYNQYLSELRAQTIADILIANGVSEDQLRVGGVGDSIPMIDPKQYPENRRVEFIYQDSMMASRQ